MWHFIVGLFQEDLTARRNHSEVDSAAFTQAKQTGKAIIDTAPVPVPYNQSDSVTYENIRATY